MIRIAKFAGVGAVGTSAHYAVMVILVETGVCVPVTATTLGFLTGAIINYLLSYRWVFRSQRRHVVAAPQFITVATFTMIINGLIVWLLTTQLSIYYLLAQVVATGVAFLGNYVLNSVWTFGVESRAEPFKSRFYKSKRNLKTTSQKLDRTDHAP